MMRTRAMFDLKPLLSVMRRTSNTYCPTGSVNVLLPMNTLHSAADPGAANSRSNGTGKAVPKAVFHWHFPVPDTPCAEVHPSGS